MKKLLKQLTTLALALALTCTYLPLPSAFAEDVPEAPVVEAQTAEPVAQEEALPAETEAPAEATAIPETEPPAGPESTPEATEAPEATPEVEASPTAGAEPDAAEPSPSPSPEAAPQETAKAAPAEGYTVPRSMLYPGETEIFHSGSAGEPAVTIECADAFLQKGEASVWSATAASPCNISLHIFFRAADAASEAYSQVDFGTSGMRYTPAAAGSCFALAVATDASGNQSVRAGACIVVRDFEAELAQKLDEIISVCAPANSRAEERVWKLYSWLYKNVTPDDAVTAGSDARAALIDGSAGQAGYAAAMKALLDALSIENRIVRGNGEDSCWNSVRIGGEWYQLDAYADDLSRSPGAHFLLTDAAMRRDHSWSDASAPDCRGTAFNYYVWKKGYTPVSDTDALDALLRALCVSPSASALIYDAGSDGSLSVSALVRSRIDAILPGVGVDVSFEKGPYASLALTVPLDAVQQIVPAEASIRLGVGDSCSLAGYTLFPAYAVSDVSFSSSKASVARVSADGKVTARKTGKAKITLRAENGVRASVQITVVKAPSSIRLLADRTTLGAGETLPLRYKLSSGSAASVSFSSSDNTVATVDAEGIVHAVSAGSVTLTARTHNKRKATLKLKITAAPIGLTLAHSECALGVGDSFTLEAQLTGGKGAVSYAVDQPQLLSVDTQTGQMRAKAVGTAIVTAQSYNGLTAACTVRIVPAPTFVELTADHSTLGVGEELSLTVQSDAPGTVGTLRLSSSKSSVVRVNADGSITAKRTGTAWISVKTYNKLTAKIKITVKKKPTKVYLKDTRDRIGVGEHFTPGVRFSSGAGGGVTFSSSDKTIADIAADGSVLGLKPGTVRLTVESYNKKRASMTLTVCPGPTALSLKPSALILGVGESAAASVSMDAASAGAVRFALDNKDAAVDEDGLVTGRAVGTATLTATAYNGVSASIPVEIKAAPAWVRLPSGTLKIGVGDSYSLSAVLPDGAAGAVRFSTSSSRYVKVSSGGVITGVRTGSATITVKTYNGKKDSVKIKVVKAPASVSLSCDSLTLGIGETAALKASLSSGTVGSISYASSDEGVATVDANGNVQANAAGTARITVRSYNGKTAACTVTVVPAPEAITLSGPAVLGVGETAYLAAALSPIRSASAIRISASPAAAVKLGEDGAVTAVKTGSVTLTASTYVPGVEASLTIEILPAPTKLRLAQTAYTLEVGETLQLEPVISEGSHAAFSYLSSNTACLTVDANGLVTPHSLGQAQVKITTHNGLSVVADITVFDPYSPSTITLGETPAYLEIGEVFTPELIVFPETASADMQWSSSSAKIAAVDPALGTVTAVSYGRVTLTGKSARNPALSVSYTLIVLSSDRCLVMPARRTGISEISRNLSRIRAVEDSAYRELETLSVKGEIGSAEYSKRRAIVANAFKMYAFPWMTPSYQRYWKAANSENGAKDFKPGIVYYGMPYIDSPWANRLYNTSKALKEKRYTDSGNGYYLLNRSNLLGGMYCGNDCSSFVSMAIWGGSGSHSNDTTNGIGTASVYKNVSSYQKLRPGDLLNRPGRHVVMFLYYANEEKTQMVIIEQGGTEAAINTCSTSVKDVGTYEKQGYIIKRLRSFG